MRFKSLFFLIIFIGSACSVSSDEIEIDAISMSFIQEEILMKSNAEKNVIFFIAGKSCSVCIEELVEYINHFNPHDYLINVVSNGSEVKEGLTLDFDKNNYLPFELFTLEKNGFSMINNEVYFFNGDDLIYKNILVETEFDSINAKMEELYD